MAMRPIWKGSISFGLVNIPVSLYLAAKSERVSFKMLHAPDQGRIHYKRVCEVDEQEVPWDEIVKGYEYQRGEYVEINDEDLDGIDIGLSHVVDIVQFVDGVEIDPVFYDKPYYLEPSRGSERAYSLLREALVRSGKVGIARVVFREREYLAAVRPRGEMLGLDTMRFAAEIRDPAELHRPTGAAGDLPEQQMDLAMLLIDQLTAPWQPEAFTDRYQEAVSRMIDRKLQGLPAPTRAAAPRRGEVIDLAEILRQSLARAQQDAGAVPAVSEETGTEGEAEEAAREAPRAKKRPAQGERRAPAASRAARVASESASRGETKPPAVKKAAPRRKK